MICDYDYIVLLWIILDKRLMGRGFLGLFLLASAGYNLVLFLISI